MIEMNADIMAEVKNDASELKKITVQKIKLLIESGDREWLSDRSKVSDWNFNVR